MQSSSVWIRYSFALVLYVAMITSVEAQSSKQRKPQRAESPKLSASDFSGAFFPDVTSVLQGERPTEPMRIATSSANGKPATTPSASAETPAGDAMGWPKIITAGTIEDAVKGSKQRLEAALLSAPKFKSGGNKEARREFSLQATLFAIIEQYPSEVRWKKSAAAARERFTKVANNAKANTDPVYAEAKSRLQDLNDLLSGSQLDGSATTELVWGEIIDRGPLMELLEWSHQDHLLPYSSSPANFAEHKEELARYAELVAALGKMSTMKDMPDAADADYKKLAEEMVNQAGQIVLAVKTDNADLARQAAGQVGQCCSKCHDTYR